MRGATTLGVLRRDVGGLKKSSGVSFQLLMFLSLDGGAMEGDALRVLGGGPKLWLRGVGAPYASGGTMPSCCR